jgi:hypothetical protein
VCVDLGPEGGGGEVKERERRGIFLFFIFPVIPFYFLLFPLFPFIPFYFLKSFYYLFSLSNNCD